MIIHRIRQPLIRALCRRWRAVASAVWLSATGTHDGGGEGGPGRGRSRQWAAGPSLLSGTDRHGHGTVTSPPAGYSEGHYHSDGSLAAVAPAGRGTEQGAADRDS